MTVGAGFALDAIRRARQFEREMSKRTARVRARPKSKEDRHQTESFPCLFLCGSCGFLVEPSSGDPHRSDPEQPDSVLARDCPHCGGRAWIDLRNTTSALAVRDMEEGLRHEPPDWVRNRIRAASGGVGAVTTGVAALVMATLLAPAIGPLAVLSAATGGVAALTTSSLLGKPLSRLLLARTPGGPARWLRPLPVVDQGSDVAATHSGVVRSNADPLVAPFSGRECLAYEIGVVFDADGDAYPPVWVLREVRSRELEVDGVAVEAGQLELELPMSAVAELSASNKDLSVFLRQRGLFASDGRFDFFEAIVPAGEAVQLRRHAQPDNGPWVLHASAPALSWDGLMRG